MMFARAVRNTLFRIGLDVNLARLSKRAQMEPEFLAAAALVRPFSLTSLDSLHNTWKACEYVAKRNIPGAFVECGVWKGGQSMLAAIALERFGTCRDLWLYDTYSGMPPASSKDADAWGSGAEERRRSGRGRGMWEPVSTDIVKANFRFVGASIEHVRFVEGMVEETIPSQAPDMIAVLRLDTDFYASTKHELTHLEPRLAPGGVLIVNDYGWWKGAKRAVDEYFIDRPSFLAWVDFGERVTLRC